MGQAVIIEDRGLGLYRIRLVYDTTRIDAELAKLQQDETAYLGRLNSALRTLLDLRRARYDAAVALNELVKQWKEGLISKLNETPPIIPPETENDPETGLPWTDPDKAQWGPLFDAINAARTANGAATLARNADLDKAIQRHLRIIAGTGYITHEDGTNGPLGRAWKAGYDPDLTVGVGQLLAFGPHSPSDAVAVWLNAYSANRAILLDGDYVDCGVGYVFAGSNPWTYLWGATFGKQGPPVDNIIDEDPAKEAAEAVDKSTKGIELPEIDGPKKFAAAAAEAARAANRVTAAEAEVQRMQTDRVERLRRIAELTQLQSQANQIIEAWSCAPPDILRVGDTVSTAELPGFFSNTVTPRIETFVVELGSSSEFTVAWEERPIQIIPPRAAGRLNQTLGMTPAQTFVAAAMEPGALRWRPLWRWGTITALNGNSCDVTLDAMSKRQFRGLQNNLVLDTAEQRSLTGVPIVYPPCNGQVFLVGDEVLIFYLNQDRTKPRVIGFRYGPRICPQGRQTWRAV